MNGLLVMAHGAPRSLAEVEAYYTHIRHGRPPSPEDLADLQRRYRVIGGVSPLAERTRAQADRIAAALQSEADGWCVTIGNKHAPPFVEDAVAELLRTGVERVVGLVLAPHYSSASVGEYHERAAVAVQGTEVDYRGIRSWHHLPAWLDGLAERVHVALGRLPAATKVLFTAHSLPERVLDGDPYADELRASAEAIAGRTGLDRWSGWALAWQSRGRTPEPWRGPDVLDVIRDLRNTGRAQGVLVCPQGFVSDHLEILYDLDVDARRVAGDGGLVFARTASINDDPAVMGALADLVLATVRAPASPASGP